MILHTYPAAYLSALASSYVMGVVTVGASCVVTVNSLAINSWNSRLLIHWKKIGCFSKQHRSRNSCQSFLNGSDTLNVWKLLWVRGFLAHNLSGTHFLRASTSFLERTFRSAWLPESPAHSKNLDTVDKATKVWGNWRPPPLVYFQQIDCLLHYLSIIITFCII